MQRDSKKRFLILLTAVMILCVSITYVSYRFFYKDVKINEFEMDVTVMRLLFLASFVLLGIGPVIYVLLWIFMPSE